MFKKCFFSFHNFFLVINRGKISMSGPPPFIFGGPASCQFVYHVLSSLPESSDSGKGEVSDVSERIGSLDFISSFLACGHMTIAAK